MSQRYEGGLGTRGDGDLVQWALEIDDGMDRAEVFGRGNSLYFQARVPDATLTLKSVSKEESIAVIALLNEMRSAQRGEVFTPSTIGNRFSGLEFD